MSRDHAGGVLICVSAPSHWPEFVRYSNLAMPTTGGICMKSRFTFVAGLLAASVFFPLLASAQHYNQKNLVSDISQPDNADGSSVVLDPNLVNPWGITRSATSPWWISDNNAGTSTLYTGTGVPASFFPDPAGSRFDNFIFVPPPGFATAGTLAAPTGIVFNGNAKIFLLNKGTPQGQSAIFIFATEDGTISGWNPAVNVAAGAKPPSINAVLEVDNSENGSADGAVYKGATTAVLNGQTYLYVTNFRKARVEVYDGNFQPVHFADDAFDADHIPRG